MNDAMAPTRAFDRTLPPAEALGRIRDAFGEFYGVFGDPDEDGAAR
jgi:hypothetical protein